MAQQPDLLAATAALVDIASPSHHEGPITDHFERAFGSIPGLEVTRVDHNLVARTSLGRGTRVLLAGHSDTVPANGNASARIDGDTLHGVGSADMKGGLAVMMALAAEITAPTVDVTYVIYEAEEVADEHNGLRKLFTQVPDLLEADVALLGEPTSAMIEAGCQGTMRAVVTINGSRAHTARPWMGTNAIHALGPVLARIAAVEARTPVIEGCTFREATQAVFVDGGIAGNVVPDRATVTVNHRFAPDRTPEQATEFLRDVVGPCDGFEVTDIAPAAYPATGHPVVQAMVERHALAVDAKLGWTDVARFAEHGIPAANFGPGDATLAHTAEERVDRASLDRTYEVLRDLLTT